MNLKKITSLALLLSFTSITSLSAQIKSTSEVFQTLKEKDSILFNVGFNTCSTAAFEEIINEDFEFYHDESGVTTSKSSFITAIRDGLCGNKDAFRSRRELIPESLEVFLLKDNGVVYGAIQKGIHRFFERVPGNKETPGSTAKFTHLWVLVANEWKLKRILSYDHTMGNN